MAEDEAGTGFGGRDHPELASATDRVEPVPRRIRAYVGGVAVLDTTRALYVWEKPSYPAYYIPWADVDPAYVVDEGRHVRLRRGPADRFGLRVGERSVASVAHRYAEGADLGLAGYARFDWEALDAWFEEDEEVFVHPRSPYVRVDALRSHRELRVELDGTVLAETRSPVLLFETGLTTRFYVDRTDVHLEHLLATETRTSCPYKGTTSGYWSVRLGDEVHADLAWSYDFPTAAVRSIQGMIAFYDEQVDVWLDGRLRPRPAG